MKADFDALFGFDEGKGWGGDPSLYLFPEDIGDDFVVDEEGDDLIGCSSAVVDAVTWIGCGEPDSLGRSFSGKNLLGEEDGLLGIESPLVFLHENFRFIGSGIGDAESVAFFGILKNFDKRDAKCFGSDVFGCFCWFVRCRGGDVVETGEVE